MSDLLPSGGKANANGKCTSDCYYLKPGLIKFFVVVNLFGVF